MNNDRQRKKKLILLTAITVVVLVIVGCSIAAAFAFSRKSISQGSVVEDRLAATKNGNKTVDGKQIKGTPSKSKENQQPTSTNQEQTPTALSTFPLQGKKLAEPFGIVNYGNPETTDVFKYNHGAYFAVMSQETVQLLDINLADKNLQGKRLKDVIQEYNLPLDNAGDMARALFATRLPVIFAESSSKVTEWTKQEQKIQGALAVVMHGLAFDNASWETFKPLPAPMPVTMAYVSGALRRVGFPDHDEIVNGTCSLKELYARRFVPVFAALSKIVYGIDPNGRGLVLTCALGTGFFAGQVGKKQATLLFAQAFREILDEYRLVHFPNLDFRVGFAQQYPIANEPKDWQERRLVFEVEQYGHLDPLDVVTQRLQVITGDQTISFVHLSILIAWDQFAWCGNDWIAGSRVSDDGHIGAATDTAAILARLEGYFKSRGNNPGYYPPENYTTWNAFITAKNLYMELKDRIYVYDKNIAASQSLVKIG